MSHAVARRRKACKSLFVPFVPFVPFVAYLGWILMMKLQIAIF
jgi:hypothetical protein